VLVVAVVQTCSVDVEGVRILHEELSDAKETGLWPQFIAELGLDLIPDLRELLVAPQLAACDRGHDLFMRHCKAEISALAVLEAEHVVAHSCPAS